MRGDLDDWDSLRSCALVLVDCELLAILQLHSPCELRVSVDGRTRTTLQALFIRLDAGPRGAAGIIQARERRSNRRVVTWLGRFLRPLRSA